MEYDPCSNGSPPDDPDEVLAIGQHTDSADSSIDDALASLEDIVFSPQFTELQDAYFDGHCHLFDESDENPLYYTQIFNDYGKLLDDYLSDRMKERLPMFNLATFASWLLTHEDEIGGDIVEMIHSTTDFLHFKSLMLQHKKDRLEKNGGHKEGNSAFVDDEDIDLSASLSIRSCRLHLN